MGVQWVCGCEDDADVVEVWERRAGSIGGTAWISRDRWRHRRGVRHGGGEDGVRLMLGAATMVRVDGAGLRARGRRDSVLWLIGHGHKMVVLAGVEGNGHGLLGGSELVCE
ncbi:hypothetical protein M0R45_035391 [Rubus argutus]|uniref:MHC class I antigen n=1 Tax=Rubus argutus TaxID=59490 RepID=A0AAW1VX65_RUBAR